jgi:hypothetical protein
MKLSEVLLGVSALLVCAVPALGQESGKIRVKVICSCDDNVGQMYASALRDALATSPRYKETSEDSFKKPDGTIAYYPFTIDAVSLDPSGNNNGQETVVSVALTVGSMYLTNLVQYCPVAKVAECAHRALASLDRAINSN